MSIRKGIPHLYSTVTPKGNLTPSLSREDFLSLFDSNGIIKLNKVTEKTDGMSWVIGFDEHGFFTQHSGNGSVRIRTQDEHYTHLEGKAAAKSKEVNETLAIAAGLFHKHLELNSLLQQTLEIQHSIQNKTVLLKGEAFIRSLGNLDKGKIKFVNISYDNWWVGSVGTFILHTQLEENSWVIDQDYILQCSNGDIFIDHDLIDLETKELCLIDLMDDLWYTDSLDWIRQATHNRIKQVLDTGKYKWGPETEGWVIHHPLTRFKIVSNTFTERKYLVDSNGR